MTIKTYELPMSRDYVRHWGLMEAVRELLQNAIDSDSPFEYSFGDESLTITSRYSQLDARTLVLGATSKASDAEKIGSFGEGYKIALLVLARLGKRVSVMNGDRLWLPHFRMSEVFDAEVFAINDDLSTEPNNGVVFQINDLSEDEQDAIRDSCLMMQRPMTDVIGTSLGLILPSRPGKLYVGSLFVCDTKLHYGYDVLPKHLALERDRKTVDGFDLKWLVKDMWHATRLWDQVAQMLLDNVPDVEYAAVYAPRELKDACLALHDRKSPGAMVAKDQADLDRLKAVGSVRTAVVPHGFYSAVTGSSGYASRIKLVEAATPMEALEGWFEDHKKYLKRMPKVAFKKLLKEAGNWRTK